MKIMETKKCKVCGEDKPLDEFYKNRLGYTDVCKCCVTKKRKCSREKKDETNQLRRQLEDKRTIAISDFTPRELMQELKRRGYEGKITYTETHTIDLALL